MRFPSIHMNGTSQETLRREYMDAYEAVDKAVEALQKVTCHGRDYYVQSGDAASEAFAEHCERIQILTSVKSELTKILIHILDQK